DGGEVRQHAAQPPVGDVGVAGSAGLFGHRALGLLLGADEQHRAAVGGQVLDELGRLLDLFQRLTQIDDVDAVALAVDVRLHLRVPAAGLVPEVHTGLQELLHRDSAHGCGSFPGCFLRPPANLAVLADAPSTAAAAPGGASGRV